MVFKENLLKFYIFKKWVLQKRKISYPFFQSISYYNGVVTKKITFHPHFELYEFSSIITGVLEGVQYK